MDSFVEWLENYANAQSHYVKACKLVERGASRAEAARQCGIGQANFNKRYKTLQSDYETWRVQNEQLTARQHFHLPNHTVTKATVHTKVDDDGNYQVKNIWDKTELDHKIVISGIVDVIDKRIDLIPPKKPIKLLKSANKQKHPSSKLAREFIFTDYHMGMLSWYKEAGDNWDCDIALKVGKQAILEMIEVSPDADTAILVVLGDFFHYDQRDPKTNRSGHILAADGRANYMMDCGLELLEFWIDALLSTHKFVHVGIFEGNHDEILSAIVRKAYRRLLGRIYKDDRLAFIDSENPYYAMRWGNCAFGYHHGHETKPANLPQVLTRYYPEIFIGAKYSYAKTGHFHHKEKYPDKAPTEKDDGRFEVTQMRTLAAGSDYEASKGYDSIRAASVTTYHIETGFFQENEVKPSLTGNC